MLHLAVGADDGRLAIALDRLARARHVDDHGGEQFAELRRDLEDFRLQVLDEAAAGPGVGQHGRGGEEVSGFAAALPPSMKVRSVRLKVLRSWKRHVVGAQMCLLSDRKMVYN